MSNRFNWRLTLALAGVLLLMLTGVVSAQLTSGNIYGKCMDKDGGALPGVSVTLSGIGAPQTVITDSQGNFRFLGLSPGNYRIEGSLEGFSNVVYDTVNVRVGQNTSIELHMTPAVEETITVTTESPLLDERKISTGATISQVELQKIPTSRDPWAVLSTVPGVLVDRVNVGGNESGQQSNFIGPGTGTGDSSWSVDGVEITDPAARGSSPTYYNFDEFQEMAISTGGTDIESRTAGVQLNLVSKRGTNEWRAEGRYYKTDGAWQDSVSPSNSELGKAGEWNNGNAQPSLDIGSSTDSIADYGANVGGPVIKDHLWIWGSYGKQKIDAFQLGGGTPIPDNTDLENYAGKLNAQITSSNSATAFYQYGDKKKHGRGAGATRPTETTWNQSGPTDIEKLEDTQIFSSNLYMTGMVSRVSGGFALSPLSGVGPNVPDLVRGTDYVWHNSFIFYGTDRPQDQYKIDGSYFFNTGKVNHELKFGVGYRHSEVTSTTTYQGNQLIGYKPVYLGFGHAYLGLVVSDNYWPLSKLDQKDALLQDTMTFGNATVNVGLRYDLQNGSVQTRVNPANPLFPTELPSVKPAGSGDTAFDWKTISPRLGLTYALGSERKTLLRASYSRFSDQLSTGFYQDLGGGVYRTGYFIFYDNNENNKIDPGEVGPFLGGPYTDLTSYAGKVDPGLDPKTTDEVVLGVEHALLPEFVVGANVTYRKINNIVEDYSLVVADGVTRESQRSDYVLTGHLQGTLPNGSAYNVPVYGLRDGVTRDPNSSFFRRNSDTSQDYLGFNITFNKRLANRWMMRGFFNYNNFTWNVPSQDHADPTRTVNNEDGADVLTQSAGSGTKDEVWINSKWSADINGMYQIAPDRPWGFNVSADINARQGFAIPYRVNITRSQSTDSFARTVLVSPENTSFRNDSLLLVNARIEKEFKFSDFGLTLGVDCFNLFNRQTKLQTEGLLNSTFVGTDGSTRTFSSTNGGWAREVVSPRIFRIGAKFSFR